MKFVARFFKPQMELKSLPRIHFANLPTPLEPLPRLSQALGGPRIFIKRDDCGGLATGGNKTRKLEFLIAEALAQGADTIITAGSAQSNHCRQTAAAAARCGLKSILVLRGTPPAEITGNLLLDQLLGAEVRWCGSKEREEVMDEIVASETASSRKPYPIPVGGSNALGAAAYALAMDELKSQMTTEQFAGVRFDRIVFASSSGGTHAGMVAGASLTNFPGQILGISIDDDLASLQETVSRIATETRQLLGWPGKYTPSDVSATADYLGGGYAVVGPPEREAIELFARLEGILLDPVYTGRAAAGMIDMVRRGKIAAGETILFWHTGGIPALWAFARQLLV